jgi:hypothetical protein
MTRKSSPNAPRLFLLASLAILALFPLVTGCGESSSSDSTADTQAEDVQDQDMQDGDEASLEEAVPETSTSDASDETASSEDEVIPETTASDETAGVPDADEEEDVSPETTASEMSDETKQDLQFLREEEKLARDVYLHLYEVWDASIFNNISKSEQMHMDRVGALLEAAGIEDPIIDDTVGVFVDETLDGLFDDLVALGETSLIDALIVGATIEDLDIHDIEEMITHTDDPDALSVYVPLMCGSRNHMRGFMNQLVAADGTYEAQFISAEEMATILAGDHEACTTP